MTLRWRPAAASGTLGTALALLVACGPSEPPADAGGGAVDAAEVGAVLLHYLEAVERRDTAALRALYAADGRFVWIEDGAVRYRSADDVLAGLAAFPAGTPLRTVVGEVEVAPVAGGGVHAWTPFTTRVGEGEGAFTFRGMLSFVLERDGEGWRIVGGHTSTASPSAGR